MELRVSHKRVGRDCEPKIIKINKCGEGGLYPTVCVQGGDLVHSRD